MGSSTLGRKAKKNKTGLHAAEQWKLERMRGEERTSQQVYMPI